MSRRKVLSRPAGRQGKCYFCENKTNPDWKDKDILSKFVSERGKILSRLRSFLCTKHQRRLSKAVKQARYLALFPFITKVK